MSSVKEKLIDVWSYGGGTQSVAIAALIIQGKLPKPDFAAIADTSFERGTTWDYLEKVTAPALRSVGLEIHRLPREKLVSKWSDQGPLGLFTSNETVLVPAFTSQVSTGVGKLPNYCTKGWKVEAVDRWLSQEHGIKPSKRRKWLGFSFDEPKRWIKHLDKADVFMPLVEMRLRRWESIRIVENMGWPTPPRSACYLCPNQKDDEWLDLKINHPEEFQKAVEAEREIRKIDPHAWFHVDCVPLDSIDFDKKKTTQSDIFTYCNSGECFT